MTPAGQWVVARSAALLAVAVAMALAGCAAVAPSSPAVAVLPAPEAVPAAKPAPATPPAVAAAPEAAPLASSAAAPALARLPAAPVALAPSAPQARPADGAPAAADPALNTAPPPQPALDAASPPLPAPDAALPPLPTLVAPTAADALPLPGRADTLVGLPAPVTPALVVDRARVQQGLASWYGRPFHGRTTANGETFDMYAVTAAHRTLPLPSFARVRNPANGREVVVRINDRGPFHGQRILDLSHAAAVKLGLVGGVAQVVIEPLVPAPRAKAFTAPSQAAASTRQAPPPAAVLPDRLVDPEPVREPQPPQAAAPTGPEPGLASGPALAPAQVAAALAPPPPAAARPAVGAMPSAPPAPAAGRPLDLAGAVPQAVLRAARGFWLQLAAFRDQDGAMGFRHRLARELDELAPRLTIFHERALHWLHAGPFADRADANRAAERLRTLLAAPPAVVERR